MSCAHIRQIAFLIVTLALCHGAARQDSPSPRAALQQALRELEQEARTARETFSLPRMKADFASSFAHPLDAALVSARIIKPVHRDRFIDAYVRWQLTGFLDDVPAMDDKAFESFLEALPACIENPQMTGEFVQPMMRASTADELSRSDQQRVQQLMDDLKRHRDQASVMRRPADELRQWIADRLGERGHRPLQAAFERCAALARAGWELGPIKQHIDALCERSLRDRSLTDELRQRLARQVENLAGLSALRITNAYLEENRLIVNTDEVGVQDFETRKWARLILRKDAQPLE